MAAAGYSALERMGSRQLGRITCSLEASGAVVFRIEGFAWEGAGPCLSDLLDYAADAREAAPEPEPEPTEAP